MLFFPYLQQTKEIYIVKSLETTIKKSLILNGLILKAECKEGLIITKTARKSEGSVLGPPD